MATREDVEHLKCDWASDGTWDLETTEGFEEYREELLVFRLQTEAEWRQRRQAALERKAEELGVPGNVKLAEYVLQLERRLDKMGDALDRLYR